MPSEVWWNVVHERVLGGDKIAPAELAEAVLPLLEQHLRVSRPSIRDGEMIADAAVDAVVAYVKEPTKFDSSRRSLLGYLKMAATGDLLNRLAKENRRQDRATGGSVHVVELDDLAGKELVGKADAADDLVDPIKQLFSVDRDRQMADLVVEGERSTAKFAAILGITDRPIAEQRATVKQHKDRIKKVLRRRGRECRG